MTTAAAGAVAWRRAARVLVRDPAGRILLLRHLDWPRSERAVWATPGGGVEPGETTAQAASRELAEETGLGMVVLGPAVWLRAVRARMEGVDLWQSETFHRLEVGASDVERALQPGSLDADLIDERRWWHLAEIMATTELVSPMSLLRLLS